MMKIINAKWTPKFNLLKIKCDCGEIFWQRADRKRMICPECDKIGDCMKLKSYGKVELEDEYNDKC